MNVRSQSRTYIEWGQKDMIYNRYTWIKNIFPANSKAGKCVRKLRNFLIWGKRKRYVYKAYRNGDLFSKVEIETINRCNGECSFCPVSRGNDKRPFAKMSDQLFTKIIAELGEMNYAGRLALFSNNEPFLDMKIEEKVRLAKEKCPKTFLYLYTNGDVLTVERFYKIIPFLDQLVIDNYNDKLILNSNVKVIADICKNNEELNRKVVIHLRKLNEVLFSRGGQSPNSKPSKTLNMPCIFPYQQLVIRPDGKVSLCCNDAYGKYTMGDCSQLSLKEIWYSKPFCDVRSALLESRKNVALCKYCDTL